MTVSAVLDSAGRRRSPATLPGYHASRPPRNKGMLYPADPPSVEEIVSVMCHASEDPHGWRLRAMIVMLWRGGLRVQEALALSAIDHRAPNLRSPLDQGLVHDDHVDRGAEVACSAPTETPCARRSNTQLVAPRRYDARLAAWRRA
jgi:hypothetical protein